MALADVFVVDARTLIPRGSEKELFRQKNQRGFLVSLLVDSPGYEELDSLLGPEDTLVIWTRDRKLHELLSKHRHAIRRAFGLRFPPDILYLPSVKALRSYARMVGIRYIITDDPEVQTQLQDLVPVRDARWNSVWI